MKKSIFIVLFFLVTLMAKAQMPYEQYSDDGILLDFSRIENLDFRVYFMYDLQHSGQFTYVRDEDYGKYLISPTDNDGTDFSDEFDAYYYEQLTNFNLLSKTEIDEKISEWKSGIASTDMTSILMDWFLLQSRVDNDHCANSLPFCTSETITFDAANTTNTANEPGMDDGCIGSSYNPSFYHMKIRVGGQFIIHMEGHDPVSPSIPRDIDFCMWGPYTEEEVMAHTACTNLSSGKIIDCCYSAEDTEDCYLGYEGGSHNHHNGSSHGTINYHLPVIDEYYILMITNYSREPCVISFSKVPDSGPGETDCGILPGIVTNDGPYCDGETIQLDVNEQPNGTYSWVGPDGWTSTLPHPTRENATLAMSGTYSCTTTVGTESTTANTEVIVSAVPEPIASAQPNSVNYGATTQLSAEPGALGSFTYHWEPADMVVDPNAQNTQTVPLTSAQLFTVTVTSTIAGCTGTAEVSVAVGSNLSATATADEYVICEGSSTTLHANPMNGTGSYTYSWDHPELLSSTTSQNPTATPPVGTTTFTCQVNDGMTTQDVEVTIHVNPNQVEERYITICQNGSYHFFDHGDLSAPGIYEAHIPTSLGCDSLIRLHLSNSDIFDTIINLNEDESCDSYYWDPQGKTFEGDQTLEFTRSGLYTRTYRTITDCDSVVSMNMQFKYSPRPSEIYAEDTIAPHWVIPSTEFQVNSYTFRLYEENINCQWDSIAWQCTDSQGNDLWALESYIDSTSFSSKRYICKLYVLNQVEDTIKLRATAYNSCKPAGVSQDFWMVCSFYDINDQSETNVSIYPNPTNGNINIVAQDMKRIRIINTLGQMVYDEELNGDETAINMLQFGDGIYLIQIETQYGKTVKRISVIR